MCIYAPGSVRRSPDSIRVRSEHSCREKTGEDIKSKYPKYYTIQRNKIRQNKIIKAPHTKTSMSVHCLHVHFFTYFASQCFLGGKYTIIFFKFKQFISPKSWDLISAGTNTRASVHKP